MDERCEVSARTSVSRLEDSYARGVWRPCMSASDKLRPTASMLEIQIILPADMGCERRGMSWCASR